MNLDQQKAVVARFLRQCNAYADGKLADYGLRLREAGGDDATLAAKIREWESYKAFNEHALGELATDRLDTWFDADGSG